MAEQEHAQEAAHDHEHGHDHDHGHKHEHGHDHDHDHDQPERGEQTVTVEDAGPARKRLHIEVPAERIAGKIESGYGRLQTEALVPGFRRGRVPKRLLEKRFSSSIRDDVRTQLLSECYTQAIEDEKLDVIGEPEVQDAANVKLPESGPLKFSVEVEVSPQVELPELAGLEVKKTKREIADADVAREIDAFRDRQGKSVAVPNANIEAKDYVQADVRVLAADAEAGGEAAKAEAKEGERPANEILHLPSTYILVQGEDRGFKGHVAGIVVEDLGKRLIGKKAGDTETISLTGPAGHEEDRIRNKPIAIEIRVTAVERLEPASLEALVGQFGLESADQLRERVKGMLESRRDREQQSAMHEQVANHLLDKVNLTLPEGLTGRQTARVLHRQAMELAYRGMPDEEIKGKLAELRQASEENARRQLKLFFILDQAAKNYDIDVTDAEVNGRIAMLALQQGRRPEKVRQQMMRSGEIEHLYLQIREQKTLDKVLEKAKINEIEAEAPTAETSPAQA